MAAPDLALERIRAFEAHNPEIAQGARQSTGRIKRPQGAIREAQWPAGAWWR